MRLNAATRCLMFGLGAPELAIIGVLIVLLFGVGKLSGLGKDMGTSIKEFRRAVKDDDKDDKKDAPAQQAQATVQQQLPPQAPPQYVAPPQAPQQPVAPQGEKGGGNIF